MSDNYDGPQLAQKILRQQSEIERLRAEVMRWREERDLGLEAGDDLRAEIKWLCAKNKELDTRLYESAREYSRQRTILSIEIGNLRELLRQYFRRESGEPMAYNIEEWKKRVKERIPNA